MQERLYEIRKRAKEMISSGESPERLNEIKVAILGKKGELTTIMKSLKDVAPEDRPKVGQMINEVRSEIEEQLDEANARMMAQLREAKLKAEVIDVTLPAKKPAVGHRHPNTIALEEVERIFVGLGYEVTEGPEIEKDYYNFEALNIPADHPAKDEQDTFYINGEMLLRTQTSSTQIHAMEEGRPPIRILAPGRKGTLAEFAKELFGEETKVKFRPHHFPFTEPSAEMDVSCFKCGGKGCRFCKGSGWIEILGCGMVHPRVLEKCNIDPKEYTGFAFGVGLERIALLKYEIDDMRLLYENDARFLNQF